MTAKRTKENTPESRYRLGGGHMCAGCEFTLAMHAYCVVDGPVIVQDGQQKNVIKRKNPKKKY